MPVAKRCEILADRDLVRLIWFLQFRSQPPRDGVGGRIGSVRRIADELLACVPREPREVYVENWGGQRTEGVFESWQPTVEDTTSMWLSSLTDELCAMALNPAWAGKQLSGLPQWRDTLRVYRDRCTEAPLGKLAKTSVTELTLDCLNFVRETGKAVLLEGQPRIGKSESARAFCECEAGMARYVEVPSTNDERSLYKAVAEALGVADGTSYNGRQIRERVEEVLRRSKLMLVFDEAQNLWPRRMRPTSVPVRVLWIMSLMNMGVPVAFIALPEFSAWMNIVAKKTAWSKAQIEGRIARKRRLPDLLSESDLTSLASLLLPGACDRSVKLLVNCARLHRAGAAVITDAIASAKYLASKRGASAPVFDDIRQAIEDDWLPAFPALAQPSRKGNAAPVREACGITAGRLQVTPKLEISKGPSAGMPTGVTV